jgi:hypothetical protein
MGVAGFDPRDRARSTDIGAPVRIEPAPRPAAATTTSGPSWPSVLVPGAAIAALAAGAWSIQRVRARASG